MKIDKDVLVVLNEGLSKDAMIKDLIQAAKEAFAEVIQDTELETEIDGVETSEIFGNRLAEPIKKTVQDILNALDIVVESKNDGNQPGDVKDDILRL